MLFRTPARRSARTRLFTVESLESRQLLAFGITQLPLKTSIGDSGGITTGSDGNLWFTESFDNKIGTFNPSTQVETDIALPANSTDPGGIVAGPNGSLWFTDAYQGHTSVAAINPSTHVVTQYPASPSLALPHNVGGPKRSPCLRRQWQFVAD